MKRFICFCLLLCLTGCATVILPNYVPDKNPYKRRFYADYGATVAATKKAFESAGWSVLEEADPAVYERAWQINDPNTRHVLIMTKYKRSNYGVSSSNVVLNAYIRSGVNNATEVELRYLKVSTISYKTFYKYRNDKLINRLYKAIETNLQ